MSLVTSHEITRRSRLSRGRSIKRCGPSGAAAQPGASHAATIEDQSVKSVGWSLGLLLEMKGDPPCSKPDQIPLNFLLPPSNAPTSPPAFSREAGSCMGPRADRIERGFLASRYRAAPAGSPWPSTRNQRLRQRPERVVCEISNRFRDVVGRQVPQVGNDGGPCPAPLPSGREQGDGGR